MIPLLAPLATLHAAEQRAEAAKGAVKIPSSADGSKQFVVRYRPDAAGSAVPLLVVLHSWSGGLAESPFTVLG